MKQLFVQRVKEKEAILKEAEREASVLFGKFYGQRNTVGDSPRGRRRVGHDLATKDNHL